MLKDGSGFKKVYIACGRTDLRRGIDECYPQTKM